MSKELCTTVERESFYYFLYLFHIPPLFRSISVSLAPSHLLAATPHLFRSFLLCPRISTFFFALLPTKNKRLSRSIWDSQRVKKNENATVTFPLLYLMEGHKKKDMLKKNKNKNKKLFLRRNFQATKKFRCNLNGSKAKINCRQTYDFQGYQRFRWSRADSTGGPNSET